MAGWQLWAGTGQAAASESANGSEVVADSAGRPRSHVLLAIVLDPAGGPEATGQEPPSQS